MGNEFLYKIAISLIPGIGCITAKTLIAYTGSAEQVFLEKEKSLRNIPGIGSILAKNIKTANVLPQAEKEIIFMERNKIRALFYLDENYPQRLHGCPDAPVILFLKGNPDLNCNRILSIVGTRHATEYGRQTVEYFLSELGRKGHNVLIVSGLAYGIDIHAHKMALINGLSTVAVMGHGLETIYPSIHSATAHEMELKNGGLVSDFMSNTPVDRKNFLRRNRIIAGLSDATLVIESAIKGGALVTAELANSYNRDVFAIPGRKGDIYSEGCHYLIKSNKAALIDSITDLENAMNWKDGCQPDAYQPRLFYDLTPEQNQIVEILKTQGETSIDQICLISGLSMQKISPTLLNLEFAGIVKSLPGKIYKVC